MTKTFPEIIAEHGGATAFAERLGQRPATVRMWKLRGGIPRTAWPEITIAFPSITTEVLLGAEAKVAA